VPLNKAFHALADPTRRAVVRRLRDGAATVTELAESFDMALQSFMQHLKVPEDCGLVKSKKVGRVRICEIDHQQIGSAEEWVSEFCRARERRLDRLDEHLNNVGKKRKKHDK